MLKVLIIIVIIIVVWYMFFTNKEHFDNAKSYLIKVGDSYIKLKNNNAFIFTDKRNEAQTFNITYRMNSRNKDGIYTITTTNNNIKLYMGIENGNVTLRDTQFEMASNRNFYLDKNKKLYIMENGVAKYVTTLFSTTANLITAVDITFETK